MIGEFITSSLLLILGYAYPAFQCFKTIEKNRVENSELRFWCQYWIIVAVITVLERIGDILISWLPMYGEMKLALFIYLWYPKTKGTGYVYDTLLRPYVSKHETYIDRSLLEFRDRAWNLAIYYWHNCTELGSTKILQFFNFVTTQSGRITQPNSENDEYRRAPSRPSSGIIFGRNNSDKRRPQPPAPSTSSYRSQTPINSESIQVHLQNQTHYIHPEDVLISNNSGSGKRSDTKSEHDLNTVRHRLRRFIDGN